MRARRRRGSAMPPARRYVPLPRDVEMLAWIGRAGVVELGHVARVFWGATSGATVAAARRLRVLTDNRLVAVFVRALHEPNRYCLTPRGAEFVPLSLSDGFMLRTRLSGDSISADHIVAAAAVWSALVARLASQPNAPGLLRFMTEAELRAIAGARRDALIPDAIAVLGSSLASAIAFAVEVDLGTEALPVFQRKLKRYEPHLQRRTPFHGLTLDAVLIYAKGGTRVEHLARLASRLPVASRVFLQDLRGLEPSNVLEGMIAPSAGESQSGTGFAQVDLLRGAA